MRITADNRGRIALSKLDAPFARKGGGRIGNPDQEWEVTYEGNKVTLTPAGEEPKEAWEGHPNLSPEMIGKVIRIRGLIGYSGTRSGAIRVPEGSSYGTPEEIVGVLESYSTMANSESLRLRGAEELLRMDREFNHGNQYGSGIMFWVEN